LKNQGVNIDDVVTVLVQSPLHGVHVTILGRHPKLEEQLLVVQDVVPPAYNPFPSTTLTVKFET